MTTVVASTDQTEFSNYRVFPNPFNDKLNIERDAGKEVEYFIRDSYGKLITFGMLKAENTVNMKGMSTGIYFITLKTRDYIQVEKLIKVN